MLTMLFALMMYVAALVLFIGVGVKICRYWLTPAPLKIPTTPAPTTQAGVTWRLFKEVVCFESLFKASKWTWIFGWLFHAAMLVVVLGHVRYFVEPVWQWVSLIQGIGKHAALGMLVGLAGLWLRRLLVDRVRYISAPSDHLMLALLVAIAATGFGMRTVAPVDIAALKTFVLGVMQLDWQPVPTDSLLLLHLILVAALAIVFPFSKLLHAPGVFFSPTRNQADNSRELRHVTPWASVTPAKGHSDG